MKLKNLLFLAVIVTVFGFLGCDPDDKTCTHDFSGAWQTDATDHWKVCTLCNETGQKAAHSFDGVKCTVCEYPDPSYVAEPAERNFQITDLDFLDPYEPDKRYSIAVRDDRTNCGSATLEDLGILDQLKIAIQATFDGASAANRQRFRVVFGVEGGVTIVVENPTASYTGIKAPNATTMTFHINYLQSDPADIQQQIIDALTAMFAKNFPYPSNE